MNNFEDFIFNPKLKIQLKWLLDNPKDIPPVLCFYGYPGNGKTTFSNYFSNEVGISTHYFDMNDYMMKGKSIGEMLERIKLINSTVNVFADGRKTWGKVIILDEFHNATKRQQDTLKTTLEKYSKNNNCLFILCLNVETGEYLEDKITPAIVSRVFPISFNTKMVDLPELIQSVNDKYPMLSMEDIESIMPDMRNINKKIKHNKMLASA